MKINAKYFGMISYEENDTIFLPSGLFGFEAYTKYLLIPFEEGDCLMFSLQSLENPELSFILLDPFKIVPDYKPNPSAKELHSLNLEDPADLAFFVISTIRDPLSSSTLNLKSPLGLNRSNHKARQFMLDQSDYTFRHRLDCFVKKEDPEC